MATAATRTRLQGTDTNGRSIVSTGVLLALASSKEVTLEELRVALRGSEQNVTESQLTRSLRSLVESGDVLRIRRGVYTLPSPEPAAAVATVATRDPEDAPDQIGLVPAPREANSGESQPEICSIEIATDTSSPTPVIARSLQSAPSRSRRLRDVPAVAPDAMRADPPGDSEPAEARDTATEKLSELDLTVTETDAAAVPTEMVRTTSVEDDVPTVATEPEETASDLSLTDQPSAVQLHAGYPVVNLTETATAVEGVWLRKAMLPLLWFTLTGIALMIGGAIVGAIVAVVIGALGIRSFRRASTRQRELASFEVVGSEAETRVNVVKDFDTLHAN